MENQCFRVCTYPGLRVCCKNKLVEVTLRGKKISKTNLIHANTRKAIWLIWHCAILVKSQSTEKTVA